MSGLCMGKVTATLPIYQLNEAEKDINKIWNKLKNKSDVKKLPKLSKTVGGDTDIMVGTKYLKYFPNKVIKLKTGLTLYESAFRSHDGTRGVVGGPHRSFTQTGKQFQETHFGLGAYFTDEAEQYWKEFTVNLSVPLLGNRDAWMIDACNGDYHQSTESFMAHRPPKNNKMMMI